MHIWNLTRAIVLVWWFLCEGCCFLSFPMNKFIKKMEKTHLAGVSIHTHHNVGAYQNTKETEVIPLRSHILLPIQATPLPCNPRPLHSPSDPFCVPDGRGTHKRGKVYCYRKMFTSHPKEKGWVTVLHCPRIRRVLWKTNLLRQKFIS